MKSRHLALLAVALTLAPWARADYVEVRKPASIKDAPDSQGTILVRPAQGTLLPLAEATQTNGYYHVAIPPTLEADGDDGWIYRTLVRRFTGDAPIPPVIGGPAGQLEVHVIDVGQGDGIFIRCPDGHHQLVIDSGDTRYPGSAKSFKSYLAEHQDVADPIEVAVASHPHADHIGSMAWLIDTYTVDLYVDNGETYDSATYWAIEGAYSRRQPGYWSAQDELIPKIDFCPRSDVFAEVLRPQHFGESHDPNDNSVIVRVVFGSTSFLFVGDAEAEEEQWLLDDPATRPKLDCDVLKVGHHGSRTSTTAAFLQAVSPMIAVVSSGHRDVSTNSDYRHPRFETVERLLPMLEPREGGATLLDCFDTQQDRWRKVQLSAALYATAIDADVILMSDGSTVHRRTGGSQ